MAIFSGLEERDGAWRWEAPGPGRGWSPLPDASQVEGPMGEEELYLLRLLWDLTPEGGGCLVMVEDHDVTRRYAEKETLAAVPCPAGVRRGAAGPIRDGDPALLVLPHRFGQLVELACFANREGGARVQAFACADDDAALALGTALEEPGQVDPGEHALAWGGVTLPGAEVAAAFWLVPGAGAPDLPAHVAALGERLAGDAERLAASQDPRDTRRVLQGLMG